MKTYTTISKDQANNPDLRAYLIRVFNYMGLGMLVTAAVSFLILNTPSLMNLFIATKLTAKGLAVGPTGLGYLAMFAPLGIVLWLSMKIYSMSAEKARNLFFIYAGTVGISLSLILLGRESIDVVRAFLITAATFGSMSLYGYTTKKDLSSMGSFMMMGLWGIIIASVINIFMGSAQVFFITNILAVVIFTGLTAWDIQRIKQIYYMVGTDKTNRERTAIIGALSLYLNFLNIFIALLNLTSNRD